MKTNLICAALACAVMAMTSPAALASPGTPISGTSVGLDHDPGGNGTLSKAPTDADGNVTFGKLAPGKYVLVIDGKSLIAAIDKLTPPPAKARSGPSVSLGIGGMFGGGGSHHSDHQGAGPTQGGHDGTHSGGGIGIGVAVGDVNGDGRADDAVASGYGRSITFTATVAQTATFSSTTPYCRDTAGQGSRIGFTVPEGGGSVALTISLEPANSTLNE